MTEWGVFLASILKRRDLSVRDFAEMVGESDHSNISKAMNGVPGTAGAAPRKPPLHKISEWATALGLEGEEWDRFIELAHLEHAQGITRTSLAKWRDRALDLTARLKASEEENAELRRQLEMRKRGS